MINSTLKKSISTLFLFLAFNFSFGQLAGTFTINPSSPASSSNYLTFEALTSDLELGIRTDGGTTNGPGVSAAVTVNVADGLYIENVQMSLYTGVSATNRITILSTGGDSTSVEIEYTPGASATGEVPLFMDGAQYITWNGITFRNPSTTYSIVAQFLNSASYNEFIGCQFISTLEAPDENIEFVNNLCDVFPSPGCPSPGYYANNVFDGNYIYGGDIALIVTKQGSSDASRPSGTIIKNNFIEGFNNRGAALVEHGSATIENNVLINDPNTDNCAGVFLNTPGGGDIIIRGNDIQIDVDEVGGSGLDQAWGIWTTADWGSATGDDSLVIENNFISAESVTRAYGVMSWSLDSLELFVRHNSVRIEGLGALTSPSAALAHWVITVVKQNHHISNNNLENGALGVAIDFWSETADALAEMNHNNFFTAGDTVILHGTADIDEPSLADWNAFAGWDANSLEVDPGFLSATDLHTQNCALSGAGMFFSEISMDIDGEVRPDPPTIGADEIPAYITLDVSQVICEGDSVLFEGVYLKTAGVYPHLVSGLYCDTLITLDLIVNPLPLVDLGTDFIVCQNHVFNLDAGSGMSDYNWSTSESTQEITVDASTLSVGDHTFTVTVTDGNGCTNFDDVTVSVDPCLGVDELDNKISLKLYPVPVSSTLKLEIDGLNNLEHILVEDSSGRIILTERTDTSNNFYEFDLSTLAAGIYYVRVAGQTKRFVKI